MNGRTKLAWTLLLLGGLVAACDEGASVATIVEGSRFLEADGITIRGEHVFLNAEGIRESHLLFDTMYHWRDSVDYHLVGVNLIANNEDGTERVRVTSRYGRMDPRGERFVARGNVVLFVPAEGRQLETEELYYDPNLGRIWSDSAFVMTLPGRTPIRGSSFTSDLEFGSFRAVGPGN
ncbi:MAG: LPS export ABC transporter periplasmic protein LptC [Gemmatimonadota bacterium]